MTEVNLNQKLENLIRSVADEEGFVDYSFDAKTGSLKGDGYLGVIYTVEITENKRVLNLVVKSVPDSENLRKTAPIREAFCREIYMYDIALPTLCKFEIEKEVQSPITSIAKCYKTCDVEGYEALILENLREIGYKLWDRKKTMDANHIALVFKEYAHFHALSFALRDQQPENFSKMTCVMKDIFAKALEQDDLAKSFFDIFKKNENLFDLVEEEDISKSFKKYIDSLLPWMEKLATEEDEYSVLIHGDCWCNNMMFKYEDIKDASKPTKICFLDWQISKIGSPVFDLAYFFYTSSSKHIMDNIETYLKIYHLNLSKYLRELGTDVEKVYPYEVFQKQWIEYSKFGLMMSMMVIRVMLSEMDEVPDLKEAADNGQNIAEMFCYKSKHEEKYNARVKDIVIHMYEKGFI